MTDPEHLLEDTGKSMRHVKVRNIDNIKVDAFAALIKQTAELPMS